MALVSYKCPNCGGSVVFDPKKQKFCCEFCMSEFTKEEMEAAALKSTETSGTQEESSAADTAHSFQYIYKCQIHINIIIQIA